jgi:hypothetical protein
MTEPMISKFYGGPSKCYNETYTKLDVVRRSETAESKPGSATSVVVLCTFLPIP